MSPALELDRELLLDSLVNVVPLSIIVAMTGVFVAYNPWGWQDPLAVVVVFGLHLIPILTLIPVTYLFVKIVSESADGRSPTAERIQHWFASTGDDDE